MDSAERRILRRKKQLLSTKFRLTDAYIKQFKEDLSISDGNWEIITGESTNLCRVGRLIDFYPSDPDSFNYLCTTLDVEYEFLADDLRSEIKVERDELEIDDYIKEESNILINREFGQSKRLTDEERRDLSELLAKRTQCAKEVWQRQLSKAWTNLQNVRGENHLRDEQICTLIHNISRFLRVQQSRITGTNPEDFNDPDLTGLSGKQLLDILQQRINLTISIISKILDDKRKLEEERIKTLYLLQVKDKNTQIEHAVEVAIENAKLKLTEAEQEVREKNETGVELRRTIEKLKTENKTDSVMHDASMVGLKTHLKTCHVRVRELETNLQVLRRELRCAMKQRASYQRRAELLMRHRTLGYLSEREKSSLVLDTEADS